MNRNRSALIYPEVLINYLIPCLKICLVCVFEYCGLVGHNTVCICIVHGDKSYKRNLISVCVCFEILVYCLQQEKQIQGK